MSEPIPESVPVSADQRRRNGEPASKRRALSPKSKHASNVGALFQDPERDIKVPSGPTKKELAPPPEIVTNVQGSSAGAGSGEFHVYKASRRREAERLRLMEDEVEKQRKDREWEEKREKIKEEDEKKLNKNRVRRAKQKQRKEKAKQATKSDGATGANDDKVSKGDDGNVDEGKASKDDAPGNVNGSEHSPPPKHDHGDDEFTEEGITINDG